MVPDFVRFSILNDTVDDLTDTLQELTSMKLAADGMEVMFITNSFRDQTSERQYKDLRLGILASLGENGPLLIVEVQLVLKKYLMIHRHRRLLDSYERGAYVDANYKMRTGCTERVAGAKRERSMRSAVKGSEERIRFEVQSKPHVEPVLWCWEPKEQLVFEGLLTPQSAHTFANGKMQQWVELLPNGMPVEIQASDIGSLTEGRSNTHVKDINHVDLSMCLQGEGIKLSQAELEHLKLDLAAGEGTLYRDPEGVLTLLRDFVVIRQHSKKKYISGGPDDGILMRENHDGKVFPSLIRRATENIQAVSQRVLHNSLPEALRSEGCVEIRPFDQESGLWIVPDDAHSIGDEVQKSAGKHLRAARREFTFIAVIGEDADTKCPFSLLQAGLAHR